MSLQDLTGKIAVVTGGSRGIGFHTATALHEAGAVVVITGRNQKTLQSAAKQIGRRCTPIVCDQRDADAVEALGRRVLEQVGPPDILVANAGGGWGRAEVATMPLEHWQNTIDTNLTGTFLTIRAFLPAMMDKQRGDIFIISSMSGKKGDPGSAAYSASKFGLQGMAQSLNYEVRRHNIRVMVLNPSGVNTGADDGPPHGPGLQLHAADLADTIVHLARLPGRTLVRDMDVWGTNPF
jgi:3-oxoacyl-[acyl-carrier protein] reductase